VYRLRLLGALACVCLDSWSSGAGANHCNGTGDRIFYFTGLRIVKVVSKLLTSSVVLGIIFKITKICLVELTNSTPDATQNTTNDEFIYLYAASF
jgi:hypothetical protein